MQTLAMTDDLCPALVAIQLSLVTHNQQVVTSSRQGNIHTPAHTHTQIYIIQLQLSTVTVKNQITIVEPIYKISRLRGSAPRAGGGHPVFLRLDDKASYPFILSFSAFNFKVLLSVFASPSNLSPHVYLQSSSSSSCPCPDYRLWPYGHCTNKTSSSNLNDIISILVTFFSFFLFLKAV